MMFVSTGFLCFFTLFAFGALNTCQGQISCNNAYECGYESSLEGSFNCYGFSSCRQIDQLSATGDVKCYGSYSCYGIDTIDIISDDNIAIWCLGLYSCARIYNEIAINYAANLYCAGESSCDGAHVNGVENTYSIISCEAALSCANSVIENISNVYSYAYLAFYNSIITMSDGTIHMLFATDGAVNAKMICSQGYNCYIECYSHACNNITIICDNCTKVDVTCNYEFKNDACPNGLELPSDIDMNVLKPNLLEYNDYIESSSNYQNSYFECSSSLYNSTNCDSYQECSSDRARVNGSKYNLENNINNNLCCTAYESCNKYDNRILIRENGDIRCDGASSCPNNKNITATNGNIYMTSTKTGTLDTPLEYISGTEYITDIHCSGLYACDDGAAIINFNNLYCLATSSCYSASVYNGKNVFIYGYLTGQYITVSNLLENGTLYCAGYRACKDAYNVGPNVCNVYATGYQALGKSTIDGINNNVIAAGYQALYRSTIYNITNELICIGTYCLQLTDVKNTNKVRCDGQYACYKSTLDNVTQINCNGEFSCRETTMTNMYNITAYGNDSLIDSTIISGITNDELFISIYNDNTNGYVSIYCNASVTCYIDCESSAACIKMKLYCENKNCFVYCDENNNILCPAFGNYYIWDKTMTTTIPTNLPSIVPTNIPTKMLTMVPSSMPTIIPSVIPTVVTTNVITSIATSEPTSISSLTTTTRSDSMSSITNDDDGDSSAISNDNNNNNNNSNDNNDDDDDDSSLNMNVVFICISAIFMIIIIAVTYCVSKYFQFEKSNDNESKMNDVNQLINHNNNDNDNNNNDSNANDGNEIDSNNIEMQKTEPPMKQQRSSSRNGKGYISVGI